jgi:hypothetical protein
MADLLVVAAIAVFVAAMLGLTWARYLGSYMAAVFGGRGRLPLGRERAIARATGLAAPGGQGPARLMQTAAELTSNAL